MTEQTAAESLMRMVEDMRNVVAAFTGIKAEFVRAGLSVEMAERMVHQILTNAGQQKAGGAK